jgi:hypothetical protein
MHCTAFTDKGKPCWELTRCQREGGCENCVVFIRNGKKMTK